MKSYFPIANYKNYKGFTLIELLVVIAIIGVLASIVLASLGTARKKGRDAKRIGDLRSVQLALELYFDSNTAYPATTGWASLTTALTGNNCNGAPCISAMPVDPLNYGPLYIYEYAGTANDYVLKAYLEDVNNPALNNDVDGASVGPRPDDCSDPFYCLRP